MYSLLQLIHLLLLHLMHWLQPYLTPICSLIAWSVLILGLWQLVSATRDGVHHAQTLHRIPCANCSFFTNEAVLKCTLHPTIAMSETAIDCADFESNSPIVAAQQRLRS